MSVSTFDRRTALAAQESRLRQIVLDTLAAKVDLSSPLRTATRSSRVETNARVTLERATGSVGKVVGYGIVTGQESLDLGGFREVVSPEALRSAVANATDVQLLLGHNANQILARQSNGSLGLAVDNHGLRFEASLPDVSWARDAAELIRQGLVKGASFGFKILKDSWSSDGRLRTLREIELFEISLTPSPAYVGTSVGLRQLATRSIARDESSFVSPRAVAATNTALARAAAIHAHRLNQLREREYQLRRMGSAF